jgi:hypothetical protein
MKSRDVVLLHALDELRNLIVRVCRALFNDRVRGVDVAGGFARLQLQVIYRPRTTVHLQAWSIDAMVFDLKAVNPNIVATIDKRVPAEVIQCIENQGRAVSQAFGRLGMLIS